MPDEPLRCQNCRARLSSAATRCHYCGSENLAHKDPNDALPAPSPIEHRPQPAVTASQDDAPPHGGRPNPVGLAVGALGGALVIIGSFVPVHSFASIPVAKNSFVASGDWWVLVVGIALVVAVGYALRDGTAKAAATRIIIPSVVAVGAGIYGLSAGFQKLQLTDFGQAIGRSVKGSPGVGVYLVLAGGIIGLVSTVLTLQAFPVTRRPEPPEASPDLGGRLQRLADLHAAGALTDDEFAAAKQQELG